MNTPVYITTTLILRYVMIYVMLKLCFRLVSLIHKVTGDFWVPWPQKASPTQGYDIYFDILSRFTIIAALKGKGVLKILSLNNM